ncbi:MAG: xanthine dehydrogenase family protein, partial [Verrucomicrobiota bacterium]
MGILKEKSRFKIVGKGIPRFDAGEKVRGEAEYADDIDIPGVWHAFVVRSPLSHGRLKGLTFSPDFDWSRVVVVTPEDIPGENIVDMMGRDMPFIAHDLIRYAGEPLALVAAATLHEAMEAAAHVQPEIEELNPVLTLRDVIDRVKHDPDSLDRLWAQTIVKGEVEQALEHADRILDDEYWCGHQEQLYIEPQGMAAIPERIEAP